MENGVASINDNTANNRIDARLQSGGSSFVSFISSGGVNQATLIDSGTYAPGTTYKRVVAYKANDFGSATNGGTVSTDASGTVPSGLTQMRLGQLDAGTGPLNGWIRKITYYPTRLTNAQMQTLTA